MQEKKRFHLALSVQLCVLRRLKLRWFVVSIESQFKLNFTVFEIMLREFDMQFL